jgi:Mg2+-importing ATPase
MEQPNLVQPPEPMDLSTRGLSSAEARRRFAEFGPNEVVGTRRSRALVQLLLLSANPLVLILLVTTGVSAALGELLNATIIVVIVLMGIGLNFFQTYRSKRAIERIATQAVMPQRSTVEDLVSKLGPLGSGDLWSACQTLVGRRLGGTCSSLG